MRFLLLTPPTPACALASNLGALSFDTDGSMAYSRRRHRGKEEKIPGEKKMYRFTWQEPARTEFFRMKMTSYLYYGLVETS